MFAQIWASPWTCNMACASTLTDSFPPRLPVTSSGRQVQRPIPRALRQSVGRWRSFDRVSGIVVEDIITAGGSYTCLEW